MFACRIKFRAKLYEMNLVYVHPVIMKSNKYLLQKVKHEFLHQIFPLAYGNLTVSMHSCMGAGDFAVF